MKSRPALPTVGASRDLSRADPGGRDHPKARLVQPEPIGPRRKIALVEALRVPLLDGSEAGQAKFLFCLRRGQGEQCGVALHFMLSDGGWSGRSMRRGGLREGHW